MAIFNQQSSAKKDVPSFANNDAAPNPQAAQTPTPIRATPAAADFSPTQAAPPRAAAEPPAHESLTAADLTIAGNIEGADHVRLDGKSQGAADVKSSAERRVGKDSVSKVSILGRRPTNKQKP